MAGEVSLATVPKKQIENRRLHQQIAEDLRKEQDLQHLQRELKLHRKQILQPHGQLPTMLEVGLALHPVQQEGEGGDGGVCQLILY